MSHTPSNLEMIWRHNEDCIDEASKFTEINDVVTSETELQKVELTITRRVQAMLKYLFGACQKKVEKRGTAERATAPLEQIVSRNVSEIGNPQLLIEEFAMDEVFDPTVAEALYTMEDTLHEQKDNTKPAADKKTLRDLMKRRNELLRIAA